MGFWDALLEEKKKPKASQNAKNNPHLLHFLLVFSRTLSFHANPSWGPFFLSLISSISSQSTSLSKSENEFWVWNNLKIMHPFKGPVLFEWGPTNQSSPTVAPSPFSCFQSCWHVMHQMFFLRPCGICSVNLNLSPSCCLHCKLHCLQLLWSNSRDIWRHAHGICC